MKSIKSKITKTSTNVFNVNLDLDKIFADFKIFVLLKHKGKGYISYIDADTVFGFENVMSCFKGRNGGLWVLLKGDKNSFLKNIDTDIYDCKEVTKLSFSEFPYTKVYLANLLLNSLPKYIEQEEFAMNASGGLYLTNHFKLKKIGKNLPKSIDVFHIRFEESGLDGEKGVENKYKKSNFSQMVFELSEKQFNHINLLKKYLSREQKKFSTKPRLVYSTLVKALRIAKQEDTEYYVAYGTNSLKYNKSKRTKFNSIGVTTSEYKKSRSAVYGRVYQYVKEFLGEYIQLDQEIKRTYQLDIKDKKTTSDFMDDVVKKEPVIYFVNKTDEDIESLLSYSLPLERSDEIVKGKPNIVCVYPEKDCTNKDSHYRKFNLAATEARQHIYPENIDNRPAMATSIREVLLKYDVFNLIITRFDYLSLGLEHTLRIYAIHGKSKEEDIKVMEVYPNGVINFLSDDCDKFDLDEVSTFKKKGVKYIFEYQDNINLLIDTNVSAINEIEGYSNFVAKHEKNDYADGYLIDSLMDTILNRDDLNNDLREIFEYIKEYRDLPTSDDGYDLEKHLHAENFYSKLLDNLTKVDNLTDISSKEVFKSMVLKNLAKAKGRGKIYDQIRSSLEEKFIYFESKAKEKYRELYPEGFDIHYFYYKTLDDRDSLIYKVGSCASKNQKLELTNRAEFKQLLCYDKSSKTLDFLLQMLDVDIVGSGKASAYPFICKYLKEGFSDVDDWA